jgi:pyridoxine 5-phosphate synthase
LLYFAKKEFIMILGVNIDHIAVLREARKINDPDPVEALGICKRAGADQITIHLREDRRHIHDNDVVKIIQQSALPINLECSINSDIIDIVCALKPYRVTLVPEKREEVTTEGGLDLFKYEMMIKKAIIKLRKAEIKISLFVDPNHDIITKSASFDIDMVELHTGSFANVYAMLYSSLPYSHHSIKELEISRTELEKKLEYSLTQLIDNSLLATNLNLIVAAGHGLNYQNIELIKTISNIKELNIGQSIIARSVFTGLENAIKEIKKIIN